ncbi:hypothetical protein [Noviherbaspirillum sp.]|uniref:ParB/RepB/Spo0J family partition protein n=1 Tax=Noviherbaspirillum sp. TaxID=1926288 RepID=UPI002D688D52|nr:hypothetical protein [Noviherbaspirillum sp.]HZW20239.1 hypothetical protein [Noviherbaspirillum sp.]
MSKKVMIDPELKSFLTSLTTDEYAALEQSLLAEGCRHPLVTWNGILIDGHHRYEICKRHGIPFHVVEHGRLDSRESVLLWMLQMQLSRRNLTDYQRIEMATKQEELIAARAKAKQEAGVNQHSSPSTNLSKAPAIDTRREIAARAGVSEGTVAKAKSISAHAVPEVIDALRNGAITIDAAAQVATLPPAEQSALAAAGKHAIKAAAKHVRESKKKRVANQTTTAMALNPQQEDLPPALLEELQTLRMENAVLRTENAELKERIVLLQAGRAGVAGLTQPESQSGGVAPDEDDSDALVECDYTV